MHDQGYGSMAKHKAFEFNLLILYLIVLAGLRVVMYFPTCHPYNGLCLGPPIESCKTSPRAGVMCFWKAPLISRWAALAGDSTMHSCA